jgi:pantoate--beta-alanine ligase
MKVYYSIETWQSIRSNCFTEESIGFVPTMGALHQGHLSLIKRSCDENTKTVLSIFVNPAQFNDPNDYENYPHSLEDDLEQAEKSGVDYVLVPDKKMIYPRGDCLLVQSKDLFATVCEGKQRPGHFDGVLSVVMKLLNVVRPHKAYFGEKDFQQYYLIKQMAEEYFLPVEILSCLTVRESSGLPLSSRNRLLSCSQREIARKVATLFQAACTANLNEIQQSIEKLNVVVEYMEVHKERIFIAVRLGGIRLIDNKQSL